MSDEDRRRRAEARRARTTLHRTTLQRVEADLDPVAGEAALSLVTVLTRESWAASGLPLPTYSRSSIPVRFVHWSRA